MHDEAHEDSIAALALGVPVFDELVDAAAALACVAEYERVSVFSQTET